MIPRAVPSTSGCLDRLWHAATSRWDTLGDAASILQASEPIRLPQWSTQQDVVDRDKDMCSTDKGVVELGESLAAKTRRRSRGLRETRVQRLQGFPPSSRLVGSIFSNYFGRHFAAALGAINVFDRVTPASHTALFLTHTLLHPFTTATNLQP